MRVHGYQTNTEFWNYGEQVTRIARKSLELRYRLFRIFILKVQEYL